MFNLNFEQPPRGRYKKNPFLALALAGAKNGLMVAIYALAGWRLLRFSAEICKSLLRVDIFCRGSKIIAIGLGLQLRCYIAARKGLL